MNKEVLIIEKNLLCQQYVVLSRIESTFGKNSKHKGLKIVDKAMRELLLRINEVENKLANQNG